MPIFSDAEKAEFLAASPANQQAAIAANGLTAADLAQNFNIPVAVADQWATNNGINFATPAAPIQSPFVQQPAGVTAATNAAVAQANAATQSPGIGMTAPPITVDAGGTQSGGGTPFYGTAGQQLEPRQTGEDAAGSGAPGQIPFSYGNGGSAYQLGTMPDPKALARYVSLGASVKNDPQYGPIVTYPSPNIAEVLRTNANIVNPRNAQSFASEFMNEGLGKFITTAMGMYGAGQGIEAITNYLAQNGVTNAATVAQTLTDGTLQQSVNTAQLTGGAVNDTLGSANSLWQTLTHPTGNPIVDRMLVTAVGAGASNAILAAIRGGNVTQAALTGAIAGGSGSLLNSAINGAGQIVNNGTSGTTSGGTTATTGDTTTGGANNNTFNGVTDFGQNTVTGADGTKINGDGVTTGNVTGGDLSNWGTQVNVADPSHLNNGQTNPNWTDTFSTLPTGMLPYGKQVNLSNSKVLNDGTPNPAYTTTTGTNTGTGTGTVTGTGSGTGTGAGTGGLNLGAAAIPLALGAATGALSLMKPEVQTKSTAAMSPEEQQLIALNTELTNKQLGNVNAASTLQGTSNAAAGQALNTTMANDAAVSGALSPQELATQAQQQYDRAQAAGANSDTLQAINTQIAQSGGAPTAEQVARIKAAADSAIAAGSSDINTQLQRGIGVIADEQANQRGLRFSTDTPILREGTLLARSAQDNIANLSANVRAGQANNMLSYPLQANASTSGVASNQQQINQAAQQFQADLVQKAQANRLALTGQATQGGIGLSGIGGNSAAIGALSNNQQANTTTTTTPGIGLTQIGQLASGVGGLVTALNQP